MPLNVTTIPCLSDNYAYLIECRETGETAVVDVPEAQPILNELQKQNLSLDKILLTHHHFDHIEGLEGLQTEVSAKVYGAKADAHRLPPLDVELIEGDTLTVGNSRANVMDVYGHTIGHIAFHFDSDKKIFSADSLMALGCGRVFEGTKEQMWETMQKFIALDPETLVYSGHEYTQSNANFALSIDPSNQALVERAADIETTRKAGGFTVPASIALELATNPFMRADQADMKTALDMETASDTEVFVEIRTRKDNF